jgi:signal transduction histidine kinase
VLFILIGAAGLFQIRTIERSIRELLRNEGEILFEHISREINLNLEYLSLLDERPSIMTPRFLNILVYDEAIVEYIYGVLRSSNDEEIDGLPVSGMAVHGSDGRMSSSRGRLPISMAQRAAVASGRKDTFVRMPYGANRSLVLGVRAGERFIFVALDEERLDYLRKRFIVRETIESEGRRFNVRGIVIRDGEGRTFAVLSGAGSSSGLFVLSKAMKSRFLPGYTMDISISAKLVQQIERRTVATFLIILALLVLSGAMSAYGIFLVQRRYEARMRLLEKDMAVKERLISLGKLASGMAHEIKNPLNAISMSVQRLKREFLPGGERQEEYLRFVDIMRSELLRVDRIVEDFLLSTKSQAPFLPEKLSELVDEVLLILRERAYAQGTQLVNAMKEDLAVECQRERIKQVFHNIVLNGLEAVRSGGSITVTSSREDGFAVVDVRDTGPGIPAEKKGMIFEYYYSTKDKGMGLGLPISYLIVKDHGGDLTVTSERGSGALFRICLPFGQDRGDKNRLPG